MTLEDQKESETGSQTGMSAGQCFRSVCDSSKSRLCTNCMLCAKVLSLEKAEANFRRIVFIKIVR